MRRLSALLCAVVVVVSGCRHSAPAAPPAALRVAIVGDSITVASTAQIDNALGGVYTTDIRARSGQRIDQMLGDLGTALTLRPNAVVVDLGTNDVLQGVTHRDWRTGFDRMIAALADQRCVEITTVSTLVIGWSAIPAIAAEINSAIAEAVAAHPQFHVVDWNATVHANDGTDLLLADRVHPSATGSAALASLIRSALDRDCAQHP